MGPFKRISGPCPFFSRMPSPEIRTLASGHARPLYPAGRVLGKLSPQPLKITLQMANFDSLPRTRWA